MSPNPEFVFRAVTYTLDLSLSLGETAAIAFLAPFFAGLNCLGGWSFLEQWKLDAWVRSVGLSVFTMLGLFALIGGLTFLSWFVSDQASI
ncbi:hypothetical protein [Paenibacillus puerhi]|uniref:hypothetical protein n=1 Tax=Paenibacillus puerhi TaxID=2692622 RepID=UPI0013570B8F|nr:hypothetical protein [Paenibacillus puerhi]